VRVCVCARPRECVREKASACACALESFCVSVGARGDG